MALTTLARKRIASVFEAKTNNESEISAADYFASPAISPTAGTRHCAYGLNPVSL
jgi:hypothetical protein